jgi:hypothetical protein
MHKILKERLWTGAAGFLAHILALACSTFLVLVIFSSEASAQSDSLVDCFPLAVGNRAVYRFDHLHSESSGYDGINITTTDTGTTEFLITQRTDSSDSVIWTFIEHRSYHRHIYDPANSRYSDTVLVDSVGYRLIEGGTGRHRLYRLEGCTPSDWPYCYEGFIFSGVLFFPDKLPDSISVYRYYSKDTALVTVDHAEQVWHLRMEVRLDRDFGLVYLGLDWQDVDYLESAHYTLVSENLTNVEQIGSHAAPAGFFMSQNFPNPFNPTTTIEFTLPHPGFVTLRIYNLLGEEVATLAAEHLNAGTHIRQWDASGFASGFYYARIQSQGLSDTKKLLYLR